MFEFMMPAFYKVRHSVITPSISLQPLGCTKKCITTRENYNAAQKLALSIADVLSCNGMGIFRQRVEVLEHLLQCWSQDIDVVVRGAFNK